VVVLTLSSQFARLKEKIGQENILRKFDQSNSLGEVAVIVFDGPMLAIWTVHQHWSTPTACVEQRAVGFMWQMNWRHGIISRATGGCMTEKCLLRFFGSKNFPKFYLSTSAHKPEGWDKAEALKPANNTNVNKIISEFTDLRFKFSLL
jgi:hypothetical protein